uniref:Uncharacterized protein n=1 Tax=Kalanchoe fedtschenkoi TaxID=63787 RepID=A0A7N0ZYM0_KALFE
MLKSEKSDTDSSPPPRSSLSFLAPNGIRNPYDFSDMELVSIRSYNYPSNSNNNHTGSCSHAHYTSLKDILPATPSPPSGFSPTPNSSWYEIPIRNPLVKHAALAYLQPMSAPPESGDRGFFPKLKSVCCCDVGCFEYFRKSILKLLWNRRDSDDDEDAEYDEDEDGYCCGRGKVD